MRKAFAKKLLSYLLTLVMAISLLPVGTLAAGAAGYSIMPPVTEKFSTETDGSTTFTEGGLTFNATGFLHVEQRAGYGFDDNLFVDNSGNPVVGGGVVGSFECTTSDFTVHSMKLITLNSAFLIEQYNNILIRGKLGGSQVFEHTVLYDSINTKADNNFYTIVDLSSYSSDVIDELEFTILHYDDKDYIEHLMIDDLCISQVVADTAPTVTTGAVEDVTGTTATANGNITGLGSPSATQHGFVWGTSENPTVTLETKTEQGAPADTGAFTGSITDLTAGTTYHVRAYATNSAGTSYGEDVTFETTAAPEALLTVDFETAGSGYTASTSLITSPDEWWQRTDGTTVNETVSFSNKQGDFFYYGENTSDSNGTDPVDVTLSSVDVTNYTDLQMKILLAANGDSGSSFEDEDYLKIQYSYDGGAFITLTQFIAADQLNSSICLTEDRNADGVTDGVDLSHVFAEFTYDIPKVGTSLRLRVLVVSSVGGEEIGFDYIRLYGTEISNTAPTVTTGAVEDVTGTTATANGNLTSLGSPNPTAYGVCWNTTGDPTVSDNVKDLGAAAATGAFTAAVTGLTADTTYYLRAYATNTAGTAYGAEESFTTPAAAVGGWVEDEQNIFGFNYDASNSANSPVLIEFSGEWYAAWQENQKVHVAKRSSSTGTWSIIDGGGASGIGYDSTKSADSPSLAVYNGSLYAVWVEECQISVPNTTIKQQVHSARYDGGSSWTFVDGMDANGVTDFFASGYTSTDNHHASKVVAVGDNTGLYVAWSERYTGSTDAMELHVAKYDGASWGVIGNTTAVSGLNFDTSKRADYPSIATDGAGHLYLAWIEPTVTACRVHVKYFDGTNWSHLSGTGLNYDLTKYINNPPKIAYFDGAAYVAWDEANASGINQIRLKKYSSGSFTSVDGGGSTGLNHNTAKGGYFVTLAADSDNLYLAWSESAEIATQLRAVSYNMTNGITEMDSDGISTGGDATGLNMDPINGCAFGKALSCGSSGPAIIYGEYNIADYISQIQFKRYDPAFSIASDADQIADIVPTNGTLCPDVAPDVYDYRILVDKDTTSETFRVDLADPDSIFIYNGTKYPSGSSVTVNGLEVGDNIVPMKLVTKEASIVKHMSVRINRAVSDTQRMISPAADSYYDEYGYYPFGYSDSGSFTNYVGTYDADYGSAVSVLAFDLSSFANPVTAAELGVKISYVGDTRDGESPYLSLFGSDDSTWTRLSAAPASKSDTIITGDAAGIAVGSFKTVDVSAYLSGLTGNKPIFVMEGNSVGDGTECDFTFYSEENPSDRPYLILTFDSVDAPPEVTTGTVTNVTQTTATAGVNLTSLGSPNPTAYGVCWNTAGNPTVSDSLKDLGAASATGAFTAAMTGLTADTTYYVRAFATNTEGTVYGTEVSFTTPEANVVPTDISLSAAAVLENMPSDTVIGTLSTADGNTVDTFTYSLTYGAGDTDNGSFTIDGDTLKLAVTPDYETKSSYSLRIRTSDAAGATYSEVFTVSITDVNETPFITSEAGTNFAEHAAGTVYTAMATDPDAGAVLTWSITGGADSAKFSVNASTGALMFLSSPNYEIPTDADGNNTYVVTLMVSDGAFTAEKTVTVTVTNVNEVPWVTSAAAADFAENGTATAYAATAIDHDAGDILTWSIGGADAAAFNVNSATGAVTFKAAPDFENPTDANTDNVYNLTVAVADNAAIPLTMSKNVYITVTDVNEAPTVTSGAAVNYAENTAGMVYTAMATDSDAGAVLTWSITGGADSAKFTINTEAGLLAFASSPDYETPTDADGNNTYVVDLTVSDGALTAEKTVTVTVTGVNEVPWVTSDEAVDFAENGTGTAYAAQASDPDIGDILTWSISGADAAAFNVNSTTGAVTFKAAPNFENPTDADTDNVYNIMLTVTDNAASPLTASKDVAISVTDSSETPMVTAVGKTSVFTQGNADGADLFGTVTAEVIDGGQTFMGAALTVTGVGDESEYLTVDGTDILLANGAAGSLASGSYSVTVAGGTAAVTLTGMALDNAAMETLIDGVSYKSTGTASVTVGLRVVTLTQVLDSGAGSNTAVLTIAATVTVERLAAAVNSTVTAAPVSILADGIETSVVTVTLRDANGSPVAGKTVTLAQGTGSSSINPASAVTGADGIAAFEVKGLTLETVTYTAADTTDSVTVSETASVTFAVPTYLATILTKLDGAATDVSGVVLRSGGAAVTAFKTETGVYQAIMPNGTYDIYINGIYSGSGITVHYAPESAVVNCYTVTFNSVGGSPVASQTVIEGGKAAIPSIPVKPGSSFNGWYGDAGYETPWNFAEAITGTKTLYARWTAISTYTVTYEGGGSTSGSVPTDGTAYEPGGKVTVKGNVGSLAKAGSTFAGWKNGETTYTPGARFAITGNVTLTALWTPVVRSCLVTYSNNFEGAGAYTTLSDVAYGARLTAPAAPVREGHSFVGWYKDPACASAWNFASDTVTGDTTLYAKWAQNTYSVTGSVTDDDTPANPMSGAAVEVVQGNIRFGETVTDIGGSFSLTGIPDGIYNLVVTKGSQKITVYIEISGEDETAGTVTLPIGNKNSVLEVNGSGTPNVVVDNLQDVFADTGVFTPEDEANVTGVGATVEIRLTVQKNDNSANTSTVQATMTSGGFRAGMVLDVDMTKTVTSSSGALVGETPVTAVGSLIKVIIPLPLELQGKTNYVVTRAHDYEDGNGVVADDITSTPDPDDNERIVVSDDKTKLTLYVKFFSTYAIGYPAPSGGGNDGESSGYIITATAGEGGSITPAGKTSLTRGGSKTFVITADAGYSVSDVLVDGVSVGALTSYTFTDVRKAHTVEAVFIKNESLPYYTGANGKEVFVGFAAVKDGVMKYIAPNGVTVLFKENPKSFMDTVDHWARAYIDFVAQREIFVGAGEGLFAPNEGMTRGMFAAVIGRLYERSYGEIEASGSRTFTDCDTGMYYAKYVEWAAKEGIIKGDGAHRFSPNDEVTREQMAAILYRFARHLDALPEDTGAALGYTDAGSISSWAVDAARYCQSSKIITGRDGGNFAPQGMATRAEVAVILERFIEGTLG